MNNLIAGNWELIMEVVGLIILTVFVQYGVIGSFNNACKDNSKKENKSLQN